MLPGGFDGRLVEIDPGRLRYAVALELAGQQPVAAAHVESAVKAGWDGAEDDGW